MNKLCKEQFLLKYQHFKLQTIMIIIKNVAIYRNDCMVVFLWLCSYLNLITSLTMLYASKATQHHSYV